MWFDKCCSGQSSDGPFCERPRGPQERKEFLHHKLFAAP